MIRTNLHYREGTIADLEQLSALATASYAEFEKLLTPANWVVFKARVQDRTALVELIATSTVFVCIKGRQLVGMAYLVPHGNPTNIYPADWAYIRKVGVHPGARGMNIGGTLTKMCVDRAIATGEIVVGLHTSEIMDAARHIYERMGFKIETELNPLFGIKYWRYRLDI